MIRYIDFMESELADFPKFRKIDWGTYNEDRDAEIDTFPHHLHNGSESKVIGHGEITGLNALRIVISLIAGDMA